MPNGHRDPYRLSSQAPPSPAHTSDSEGTYHQKKLYDSIQRGEPAHQKLRDQALTCLRGMPGDVRRAVASYLGWTNTSEFA